MPCTAHAQCALHMAHLSKHTKYIVLVVLLADVVGVGTNKTHLALLQLQGRQNSSLAAIVMPFLH